MRIPGILLVVASLALGSAPVMAAMSGPVRTQSGWISGIPSPWQHSVTVFKGIRYAAPPIGKLRWRPPQAPARWRGVRKADHFGSVCPQPGATPAMQGSMSEDCLFLNIWTAATSSSERRPVLVWIYGGGFTVGTGSDPLFDGTGLARKGLVVVTFNYRLGVLGFLATPALSRESGHAASGNYGMLDQVAVLKWVQDNIAAFGGDPHRVTIAGQSAGAGSVGFLDMSPLARGLFQRAIGESHARYPRDPELRYLSTSYRTLANAERQGVEYAAAHGARTLPQLRAMPWQRLITDSNTYDASVQTGSDARPPLFRPVVDGWVIPKDYSQTYEQGTQTSVAYIAGNNHDETGAVPETAFAGLRAATGARKPGPGSPYPNVTLTEYRQAARQKFGPLTAEFLRLYPASNDQEAALENNTEVHDNSRISTFLWASTWTKHARGPVFTYFWTHAPPGASHDTRGAYHGSEINYVFDNLYATDRPWTSTDHRIADIMSSYWVNFAKDGNPNGEGLPPWPAFDPGKQQVMELGDHFGPVPIASNEARFDFWQRFFATQTAW